MFFEKGFICHLRKGVIYIYMLRKGLYICHHDRV